MLFIQLFLTNGPAGENLPATPHLWNCYCFISVWLCILTLLIWLFFILLFKAYQDNITSDLAYIAKGDHIFLFSS